jgi:ElaB/YqjD/DUF883 family membrane-anchored ribosome-binding protein
MSSDTRTSGPSSASTSSSEAAKRSNKKDKNYDPALDPTVADKDLSTDEYLRRQGERAKLAIMGAAGVMKSHATTAVHSSSSGVKDGLAGLAAAYNPVQFVEKRPWIAVGASAGVGFLSMLFFNPSRYGRVKSRLAKLEKLFREHEKRVVEVKAVPPPGNKGEKAGMAAGIGAALLQQGFQALKPILMQNLGPLMAKMQGHAPGHDGDGEEFRAGMGAAADRMDPTS